MSSEYYTPSGWPVTNSAGVSATARAEMALIDAGFAKLPVLSGNALKLVRVNAGATGLEAATLTTLDSVVIGGTTPAAGTFTTLISTGGTTVGGLLTASGQISATGVIRTASLGTVASVSYGWTGDDNTGMYSPGADQMAIVTGGAARVAVDAIGQVTLNKPSSAGTTLLINQHTTGPGLYVSSDSASDAEIALAAISYARDWRIKVRTADGNFVIRDSTGAADRITINAVTGTVGIGGSAVSDTFYVSGTTRLVGGSGTVDNLVLTGGSANVIFGFAAASSTAQMRNSAGTLAFAAGGTTTQMSLSAAGNVVVSTPSSGTAIAVSTLGGGNAGFYCNGSPATQNIALASGGSTTGATLIQLQNTTGLVYLGCESSAGGTLLSGSTAYSTILHANANVSLHLGTNNAVRYTISGAGAHTIAAPAANTAALTVNGSAATPKYAIGNSGTAFTLDCIKSNVQTLTMTGNVASGGWTISNPQDGQTINLFITQDGTGSRTLGWPTSFKWAGTAPAISTAASTRDLLVMTYDSTTTFWYCSLQKAFA